MFRILPNDEQGIGHCRSSEPVVPHGHVLAFEGQPRHSWMRFCPGVRFCLRRKSSQGIRRSGARPQSGEGLVKAMGLPPAPPKLPAGTRSPAPGP